MLLQHAALYHKVRDWIRQQNQQDLTYTSLLKLCELLQFQCEQYQKAQEKGHANLTKIKAASFTASLVHQDTLNTQIRCIGCGYTHPRNKCPASD